MVTRVLTSDLVSLNRLASCAHWIASEHAQVRRHIVGLTVPLAQPRIAEPT